MAQLLGAGARQRHRAPGSSSAPAPPLPQTANPSDPSRSSKGVASAAAPPDSRGRAVIVGAGPAGCVAAMFLARQGFAVKVLEKRGDPTAPGAAEVLKTTFIMVVMPRGIALLKDLGVRLPADDWVNGLAPAKGAVLHHSGRKELRPHSGNVAVERAALAKHLLQEARRLFPAIDFQFNADIKAYGLHTRTISLALGDGCGISAPGQSSWGLLVAADGVSSKVRAAVEAQVPDFKAAQKLCDLDCFVAHDLPAAAGLDPEDESAAKVGRDVHFFRAEPSAQVGPGLGAYVHEDGTYSAAMQVQRGMRPPSDVAAWQSMLEKAFLIAPKEWLAVIAKQTAGCLPHSWGSTVSCSHLTVPWAGVALVGDAGHGVTPNMGQGCNAALETVAILNEALQANRDKDLAFALSQFNDVRKPDVDALCYLDTISGRMWGGNRKSIWDINMPFITTTANIMVSGVLHKLLPFVWTPPVMLNGFSRQQTKYTEIVWCRQRDLGILVCTLATVIALCIQAARA